jgi:ectoine hydroxylase-related dioxygenase (phytanoyl-CoA dioxygenase family)
MNERSTEFELHGWTVVTSVISETQIMAAANYCDSVKLSSAGTRALLALDWCADMAQSIRSNQSIRVLLGESKTAVQCTLFVKDSERNWLVPLHRDYSFPLRGKIDSPDWSTWSVKQSVHFARPPEYVLESLIAVRVHLEDTDTDNGALQVVTGSHRSKEETGERSVQFVPRGGALVMRPLLLHASSKMKSGRRRVLHFVYGPARLPDGAEWANAV